MIWASDQDATWTPLSGGVLGMPYWKKAPGQTKDRLEGLYLPACLGTPWGPPRGAGGGRRGEGGLSFPA